MAKNKSIGPTVQLTEGTVYIIGIVGLAVVITMGLISGFVIRPGNCVKSMTTSSTTSRPLTTSTASTATTPTIPTTSTTSTTISTSTASTASTTRTTSATTTTTSTTTTTISTLTASTASTTRTTSATTTTTTTTTISTSTATTATTTRTTTTSTTTTTTTESSTMTSTRVTLTLPSGTTARLTTSRTPAPLTNFRLLTNVIPSKYDLTLSFDFNPYESRPEGTQLEYTGSVTISVDVKEPASQIILHMDRSVTLTDMNIVLTDTATGQIQTVSGGTYGLNQLFVIRPTTPLSVGSYTILIKFKSRTNEDIYYHGFKDGPAARSLVASNLAPVFARTAFPCFDEPGFKAKFSLTINHPEKSIAVSSFPVSSRRVEVDPISKQSRLVTTFQETYPMSTYHLSWAVIPDDFQSRTGQTQNVNIAVHGRRTEIEDNFGDFALQTAVKLVDALVSQTGLREALPPKIDLIALPFFPYPTSPSWGLNGFREDDILYNPRVNSEADKQKVATYLAYEIARNWFGSYITCSFWDDLWLNEGLAVHFAYKALSSIPEFSDWDMGNQFLTDHTIPVMWRDAYQRELALKFQITSNTDLRRLFTNELQSKSAALFRMIESSVPTQNFKDDVVKYLSSHAFGVTTSNYFYSIFRSPAESVITMRQWIEPYVIQKNYPIVQVETRTIGGKTFVDFTQNRYKLTTINLEIPPPSLSWPIYLKCKAGGDGNSPTNGSIQHFEYLLNAKTGSFELNQLYSWIKCNDDFGGYYMTNYSNSFFDSFEQVLLSPNSVFTPADRANLIHVSFELAFVGIKSYQIPTYLDEYLQGFETHLVPWKTFVYHMNKLAKITDHRPSFRNLRGYTLQLVKNALTQLGYDVWADSTSHNEELLKMQLAELQCRLLDAGCLTKATQLFKSIPPTYFIDPTNVPNPLSTNLRAIVYKYYLQNTNNFNDWFDLYDFYAITNDLREREYAIEALSNTRLNFLLDYILLEILSPESRLNMEDSYPLMSFIGTNPSGRYFCWYFIREKWGDLYLNNFNMRKVTLALRDIADTFEAPYLLDEMLFFFQTTYDFENGELRSQMTESLIINTHWVTALEKDFTQFFFEAPFKKDSN